jgi:hypothetical protein
MEAQTSLNIPIFVTGVKYGYVKNDDLNYPYEYYAKFTCDSATYLSLRKQISPLDATNANDDNILVSSKMICKNQMFLHGLNRFPWWDLVNDVKPSKVFVNYYYQNGVQNIGNSQRYNGIIAIFYHKQKCYIYLSVAG